MNEAGDMSTGDGLGTMIPQSAEHVRAHAVELTGLGFQVRRPDRTYYDGVWHSRRIAVLACRTLNAGESLPIAQWPDRLASDPRGQS